MKSLQDKRTFFASPYGLSLASVGLLCLTFLIPSEWYESIVREPYLVKSTSAVVPFYVSLVAVFLVGVALTQIGKVKPVRQTDPTLLLHFLHYALFALILVNLGNLAVLIKQNGALAALSTGNADSYRLYITYDSTFAIGIALLNFVIYAALYRVLQYGQTLTRAMRKVLWLEIGFGILIFAAISVVTLSRNSLVPFVFGLFVIVAYWLAVNSKISLVKLLLYPVIAAAGTIALFLVFSYLRGSSNSTLLASSVLGYSVTPFNHLSAVLNGGLNNGYAGRGPFALAFFYDIPLLKRLLDFSVLFNMPDAKTVWESEFFYTGLSGLNSQYIWVTAFGYYYLDLGWGVYPYTLLYGLMTGIAWRSFKKGGSAGAIFYPFLAGTILLWNTSYMMSRSIGNVAVCAALILLGEMLFLMFARKRRGVVLEPHKAHLVPGIGTSAKALLAGSVHGNAAVIRSLVGQAFQPSEQTPSSPEREA